jgi:hypothetical protein
LELLIHGASNGIVAVDGADRRGEVLEEALYGAAREHDAPRYYRRIWEPLWAQRSSSIPAPPGTTRKKITC